MPDGSPISKRQPPLAQYVALAVLLVMAVTYETRYIKYAFPDWFGNANAANWPFLLGVTDADLRSSASYTTPIPPPPILRRIR
jgi:hypothetical protein